MDTRPRIRQLLRHAAFTAVFGALIVPATAGAATDAPSASASAKRKKAPVVRSVTPLKLSVGDTLTLKGRHFRRGKGKNTVLFKRQRGKAVFVKADVSTAKLLKVKVPSRLMDQMLMEAGTRVPTRFSLRVLSTRLGKRFTSGKLSPVIAPAAPVAGQPGAVTPGAAAAGGAAPAGPGEVPANGDCDSDLILNSAETDDDDDLLEDAHEVRLKLDPCNSDTDLDTVPDGYEYRSALDLNDDEYQELNSSLPSPDKRPYPNPLNNDALVDYDGDGLDLVDEYRLWLYSISKGAPRQLDRLAYSDGEQQSGTYWNGSAWVTTGRGADNRRQNIVAVATYARRLAFESWLASGDGQGHRYATVRLPDETTARSIFDFNRDDTVTPGSRAIYLYSERMQLDMDDDGWLTDDERDEDADGLTNWDESHGRMNASWWKSRYDREGEFRIVYAGTQLDDPDTDGDGVRDGADDQDHDDYPNIMELSRNMTTGRGFDDPKLAKDLGNPDPWYGRVNPFNPCLPKTDSRSCPRYIPFENAWAPFDGPPYTADGDDPNYLVLN